MSSKHIPDDIWPNILKRLPVESLIRFQAVSKPWKTLIRSPAFIRDHLTTTKSTRSRHHHLLVRQGNRNKNGTFWNDEKADHYSFHHPQTLESLRSLNCPFKTGFPFCFRIVDSINGLICLSDDYEMCGNYSQYSVIIWNPMIHKYIKLPTPRYDHKYLFAHIPVFGFGFDTSTNDYKLVRLAFIDCSYYEFPGLFVELFSTRIQSWKAASLGPVKCAIAKDGWSSCFVDGFIYWIVIEQKTDYEEEEEDSYSFPTLAQVLDPQDDEVAKNMLLCFNVELEEFKLLDLPDEPAMEMSRKDVRVSRSGDLLSVLHFRDGYCDIWLMSKCSTSACDWSKAVSIEMEGGLNEVVGLKEEGQVMGWTTDGELTTYDPMTNCVDTHLGIRCDADEVFVGEFIESLVLLDVDKLFPASQVAHY